MIKTGKFWWRGVPPSQAGRVRVFALLSLCLVENAAARSTFDPYCGLYSLYAAFKIVEKPVPIESLLKPQYLGSREGSSLQELRQAALDHGLYAEPVQNLNMSALSSLSYPALLHVRASAASDRYDHWLLSARIEDGIVTVIDGPGAPTKIACGELESRWDGTALLISAEPIDLSGLRRHGALHLAFWATALTGLVLCGAFIRSLYRRRTMLRPAASLRARVVKSAAGCIVLVMVSSAAALARHTMFDDGFVVQRDAVARVQDAHWADFVPKVSQKQVRSLVGRPDVVFIDARLPGDFTRGHIEGAINIPANVGESSLRELTAKIPKDHRLVLYCQTDTCPFAKTVAQRLFAEGYRNQSLFTGGWREWSARRPK